MNLTSLGDIAEIQSGAGFPIQYQGQTEGDFPFAKVSDISLAKLREGVSISRAENYVSEATAKQLRAKIFPIKSIVFAKIGEAIRKNNRVITKLPMAFDNNVMGIIPNKEKVLPEYLYHFLETIDFYVLVNSTTVPSIRKTDMEALNVPLPPLEEQKRIAAILDQADELRRLRQRALDRLSQLGQSIFYEMFGDPVENPHKWSVSLELGEIAEIVSGITKGRKLNGQSVREVSYLAVSNVQDRHLNLTKVKTIEATSAELEKYRLKKNDLLLTEGGDPDKLGRGTLWGGELPDCIHQNHIFRVRLTSSIVRPVFLSWLVSSSRGKRYFLQSAKQTTGIASINMTQLRGFPLLLPPVSLQKQFEDRLSAMDASSESLIVSADTFENLFRSLQQRAFRGDI